MKKFFQILLLILTLSGCKKYLDKKPDKHLELPTTISALQALLDNSSVINKSAPAAGEMSTDDYYLTQIDYDNKTDATRRIYTWENQNLFPSKNNDWVNSYKQAYTANTILFNIDKIARTSTNEPDWNNVKGGALFLRGFYFAQVTWLFTKAYDPLTATADMGIPLRLDPDFNIPSVRSTLQQTYNRIIQDVKEAALLLPVKSIHPVRASRTAAYGLLARIYLSMRNYDSAWAYADKYLQLNDTLMDYNDLIDSANAPIKSYNQEVIYHCAVATQPFTGPQLKVDSVLYDMYDNDDWRKTIFFKSAGNNQYNFKGSYDGSTAAANWFAGIATDEVYLIRAECYARKAMTAEAMTDLNTLLRNRWKNTVTYLPVTAVTAGEAIQKILLERRKELIYRGLRWMDIKRLNKEGAGIILRRKINNTLYVLPPNDLRYALPIPEDVIAITGMPQNPR